MGFVTSIIILVTIVAFISCWQKATLPPGYSLKSRTLFRLAIVSVKLLQFAVSSLVITLEKF